MAQMKLIPFDDVLDREYGKPGTPLRDKFDKDVEEAVRAYRLGEAIRCERISQKLTQSQLGAKSGVMPRQISRMENGGSVSFASVAKVFKALGIVTPTVDMGACGKVALW